MTDRFEHHAASLSDPAFDAFQISPDDVTELAEITRALYIGVGGDLSVTMQSGQDIVFSGAPAGLLLPLRVSHVKNTGTTASGIVGLV